ncbi:MAG: dual specificity protein phosphatase family protein [Thermoproteota archaeon]|nr:dual specificity protein phosphatase family protein [Thermoproteota archaeon]MDQ3888433.1 dual specificity protein phosphatase family protein [Thermoproteota archaeon]
MTKIGNAYRRFHGMLSDRPTNFSWVTEDKLAGSGLPVTHDEFKWLIDKGIKSIVTVREVPLPSQWIDGTDIDYLHLMVEDYGVPNMEVLDEAVNYIDNKIQNGKPVLVHCAAGKGRTGALLAAYMIKKENLTAEQALEKIRLMRPGSVQSVTQETALSMYEKYVKSKKQ